MDKFKAMNMPQAVRQELQEEQTEQEIPTVQISAEEWMRLSETLRRMEALSAELSAQRAVLSSEAGSVNLVFGENARGFDLELLKHGSVLDMEAARILAQKGVDVGFVSCDKAELKPLSINSPIYECYFDYGEKVAVYRLPQVYNLELKEGAQVRSEISLYRKKYVASYTYENADGARFLVLSVLAIVFSVRKPKPSTATAALIVGIVAFIICFFTLVIGTVCLLL